MTHTPPIGIDKTPFAPYTGADMIWIVPSEKDAADADQFRAQSDLFCSRFAHAF